jgi:hypothetical protein
VYCWTWTIIPLLLEDDDKVTVKPVLVGEAPSALYTAILMPVVTLLQNPANTHVRPLPVTDVIDGFTSIQIKANTNALEVG